MILVRKQIKERIESKIGYNTTLSAQLIKFHGYVGVCFMYQIKY
jgi:hypothetical protein